MAVIFISPRQKQRMFLIIITAALLVFLLIVVFGTFFSKPKIAPGKMIFNKPKVNVNIKILNTQQFQDLQPFNKMEMQFSYRATTKNGKEQTGFISAVSATKAREMLERMDLEVLELKEAEIGRDNPFSPYYQIVPSPNKR